MKIFVLNGSPRGAQSNTLKLTKAFLEGYVQKQAADIEISDVSKLNVGECRGCFSCWNKTPGKCVINDDMARVNISYLNADVVIWSFPLYYFSLPSRLKLIMERQLPLLLPFMKSDADRGGHDTRYSMDGKRFVVISTCGFYTAEGNYNAVNAQFDKILGKDAYTALYCGQGELFGVPELSSRTEDYLNDLRSAGAEFAAGAITKATKEKLDRLLFPREVFEQMADASWGIEKRGEEINAVDPSLTFTRQMAALYNKASWKGRDIVLEFSYTDVYKTYQIVLGKDGQTVLTENFLPFTTKIETPLSIWKKISRGEIDGKQAMMEHLYKVTGDFTLMIKWDEYFGWNKKKETGGAVSDKKTNMNVMLIPWITIWTLLSINSLWGGIAGIAVCAALPFFYMKYRPTVFEAISVFSVTLISLLSVFDFPTDIMIPASYFVFGIMWTATVFLKIPLSACYSMNNYGSQEALNNPFFIRINRILTALWGILYLITPVWTYALLQTPLSSLTGIFNSVLPAAAGVFTVWFEKWYPKHYAGENPR